MSDEQCNHIECEIRGCDCGCHIPDEVPRCQIAAHHRSLADDPAAVERAARERFEMRGLDMRWDLLSDRGRELRMIDEAQVLRAAERGEQ